MQEHFKEMFSIVKPKIIGVIHIGAHYGIFDEKIFREYGIRNQMFFEPIIYGWNTLKNNFQNIYPIYQLAVGNENKKVIMHVDHDNSAMSSSILTPKKHLEYYPNVHFVEDIEVDMIRLDDFIPLPFYVEYNMLNIDTQGYELEVLKGAEKLIKEYIDYIYCEVNYEELYEGCPLLKDIDSYLGEKGFTRVWKKDLHFSFGDAMYVRR